MTRLRRVLNYEVTVEAVIEIAMWLAIPYLVIGLVWGFFHVEAVQQLEVQLNRVLPAGAEVGGVRPGRTAVARSPTAAAALLGLKS